MNILWETPWTALLRDIVEAVCVFAVTHVRTGYTMTCAGQPINNSGHFLQTSKRQRARLSWERSEPRTTMRRAVGFQLHLFWRKARKYRGKHERDAMRDSDELLVETRHTLFSYISPDRFDTCPVYIGHISFITDETTVMR